MADHGAQIGFPGGDADGHMQSIPACAAIGLGVHMVGGRPIETRVDNACAAACDAAGRIDPGAALLLADQAMATGVFATLADPIPMLTLDLRIDLVAPLPAAPLACIIDDVSRDGDLALVRATLAAAGERIGTVTSRYLLGAMPGGIVKVDADGAVFPVSAAATFADYLGATDEGDHHRVTPRADHVGARALPAFHGGVIAALLAHAGMAAATAFRLVDIEVRYLAPARADRPLFARVVPQRIGRRAATLDVIAYQEDAARPVAIARLLAMSDPPGARAVHRFPG